MKRTLLTALAVTAVMISPVAVHADTEATTTTEPSTTTTTSVTTTTTTIPSTAETTTTTEVSGATTQEPTTTIASNPCLSNGYVCGWAMLDDNNNVVNVIVCAYEVCGGGVWDGRRTVLQTRQMEGGNVSGYNGSTYNEASNTFAVGGGYTLVGGSEVGDLIAPSTTTTVPSPVSDTTTTVEQTTTTTIAIFASAIFGVDETVSRVSTKKVAAKRRTIASRNVPKRATVKKSVVRK